MLAALLIADAALLIVPLRTAVGVMGMIWRYPLAFMPPDAPDDILPAARDQPRIKGRVEYLGRANRTGARRTQPHSATVEIKQIFRVGASYKPSSVKDDHLSRTSVARRLQRPTREVSEQPHTPPIRSCCGWGLPRDTVTWSLVRSYRTVSSLPF